LYAKTAKISVQLVQVESSNLCVGSGMGVEARGNPRVVAIKYNAQ